ncbi:MAG TPA: hypothetical protein VLT60_09690 [Usitatibacter sp.]|nr:hypothetical protein [Usitatibacter sp.]
MDPMALALLVALPSLPVKPESYDIDAPIKRAMSELDSPELRDRVTEAMAWPYKYGVTQMPCRAKALQPERKWYPAREPSGRIEWVQGPVTKVRWAGIYGTCIIQSPEERSRVKEPERTALECECNGWMPRR